MAAHGGTSARLTPLPPATPGAAADGLRRASSAARLASRLARAPHRPPLPPAGEPSQRPWSPQLPSTCRAPRSTTLPPRAECRYGAAIAPVITGDGEGVLGKVFGLRPSSEVCMRLYIGEMYFGAASPASLRHSVIGCDRYCRQLSHLGLFQISTQKA